MAPAFKIKTASFVETFGITKDSTSNYMIIMKYYKNRNLYQYLDSHNGILPWRIIMNILRGIAEGLKKIHIKGKIHKNLHGGNLFIDEEITDTGDVGIVARIGDVGLYGPCYHENKNSDQIYGVLPYIAPEVFRGESYSAASDIYSFGIIMNTLATGKKPWYNKAHNFSLAKDICDGKRLEIPEDTPSDFANLMRQCCDDEPEKRPAVSYIYKTLYRNNTYLNFDERTRYETYTHPEIHPEAYYTSRLLDFPELVKHDH
jgi:serine/threonine protein kinase